MENSGDDWSWPTEVAYACACGAYSPVTRWRWVDADRRPELARRLRDTGPYDGTCTACARPVDGAGAWLEVSPTSSEASLVLAGHQRGELLEVLKAHLGHLQERPARARPWLISPRVVFGAPRAATAVPTPVQEASTGIPKPVGQRNWGSGPLLGADVERAVVADLSLEEGVVTAVAVLDEATRKLWGSAALQARPVLLRGLGYPLLGVRLIASYLGELAVIDALVDVGDPRANEMFVKLSQHFRLQLQIRGDGGQASTVRDIEAEPLRRNAQMCLESAQAQLGAGEFPSDAYRSARESLARMPAKQRLEPARSSLAEGAYRHLVGPAEALVALERLDTASKKDNLARLLEVDGLPVPEYEAIRKAVLSASLEFGLVAPARFWRRVLGSDLVLDAPAWIARLVAQRTAWLGRGDDLTAEQAEQAWRNIFDLCTHHDLTPPPEVVQALGLGKRGDNNSSRSHGSERVEAREGRSGSGPATLHPAPAGRAPPSQRPAPTTVRPSAETRPGPGDSQRMAAISGSYPTVPPARSSSSSSSPPPPASPAASAPSSTSSSPDTQPRVATGSFQAVPVATRAGREPVASRPPAREPAPESPRSPPTGSYPTVGTRPRRSDQPSISASGEIREPPLLMPDARSGPKPAATVRIGGGDLKQRLGRATAALTTGSAGEALALLPDLGEEELLALMPALAELGPLIVPDLLNLLSASRREVRQTAVILLGLARDRRAVDPLTKLLGQETSAVWIDAARALGNSGPRVVGQLCWLLRGVTGEKKDLLTPRVARALAELVLSDGDAPRGAGRLAVESLLEVADPAVSSAARRALDTLADVRGDGRGGGIEERELREFSTRALEAINAPELDADGAIEVVGED